MAQTGLEWLQKLYDSRPAYEEFILPEEFEFAKQMQKEQDKEKIIKAFYDGMQCSMFDANMGRAEQYYSEIYKQDETN